MGFAEGRTAVAFLFVATKPNMEPGVCVMNECRAAAAFLWVGVWLCSRFCRKEPRLTVNKKGWNRRAAQHALGQADGAGLESTSAPCSVGVGLYTRTYLTSVHYPHLSNEPNSTHPTVQLWGLSELIMGARPLAHCLECSMYFIYVSLSCYLTLRKACQWHFEDCSRCQSDIGFLFKAQRLENNCFIWESKMIPVWVSFWWVYFF